MSTPRADVGTDPRAGLMAAVAEVQQTRPRTDARPNTTRGGGMSAFRRPQWLQAAGQGQSGTPWPRWARSPTRAADDRVIAPIRLPRIELFIRGAGERAAGQAPAVPDCGLPLEPLGHRGAHAAPPNLVGTHVRAGTRSWTSATAAVMPAVICSTSAAVLMYGAWCRRGSGRGGPRHRAGWQRR